MAIVKTVPMEKDGAKMRVNESDVAKYRAQGWDVASPKAPATGGSAEADTLETPESDKAKDEAKAESSEPESPTMVKMRKDDAEQDVAPDKVAEMAANGWTKVE